MYLSTCHEMGNISKYMQLFLLLQVKQNHRSAQKKNSHKEKLLGFRGKKKHKPTNQANKKPGAEIQDHIYSAPFLCQGA